MKKKITFRIVIMMRRKTLILINLGIFSLIAQNRPFFSFFFRLFFFSFVHKTIKNRTYAVSRYFGTKIIDCRYLQKKHFCLKRFFHFSFRYFSLQEQRFFFPFSRLQTSQSHFIRFYFLSNHRLFNFYFNHLNFLHSQKSITFFSS